MKRLWLLASISVWAFSQLNAQVTRVERGHAMFKVQDYSEAIESYEAALSNNPQEVDPLALTRLADSYRFLNEFEKAEAKYALAIQQASSDPKTLFHYALMLKSNGRLNEAKKWFKKYSELNPGVGGQYMASCSFVEAEKQTPAKFEVKNTAASSKADDYNPTVVDGKLVFASARTRELPNAMFLGSSANYLYLGQLDARGGISSVTPLNDQAALLQVGNEAPITFIPSRKKVLATIQNGFKDGVRHIDGSGMNLTLAEYKYTALDQWLAESETEFPFLVQNYSTGFPSVSADGNTLYFASNRPGGSGGYDLYVSYYQKGRWTRPENLGPTINTPGDELSPFFDSQRKVLYFSSNFHLGMGGMDIFRVKYNPQQQTWGSVDNLGAQVNSSHDDMYFVMHPTKDIGYFSSNRKTSLGGYDIYTAIPVSEDFSSVTTPKEIPVVVQPTPPKTTPTPKPPKEVPAPPTSGGQRNNTPMVSEVDRPCGKDFYVGSVINAKTKKPEANVNITVLNYKTNQAERTTTNKYGEFALIMKPLNSYNIKLDKAGFALTDYPVDTETGGRRTLISNLEIFPQGYTKPSASSTPIASTPPPALPSGTRPRGSTLTTRYDAQSTFYEIGNYTHTPPQVAYSIQVKIAPVLSEAELNSLSQHGGVFGVPRSPNTVYMLGLYADEAHMREALTRIRAAGYKDAFPHSYVAEGLDFKRAFEYGGKLIYPRSAKPAKEVVIQPTSPSTPTATIDESKLEYTFRPTADIPATIYQVQVAVSGGMAKSEREKLMIHGPLLTEARGSKKAYQLGPFAEEAHAREVLAWVKDNGYPSAFLRKNDTKSSNALQLKGQLAYPKTSFVKSKNTPTSSSDKSWVRNDFETPKATLVSNAGVHFRVQLGVFKKEEDAQFDAIKDLGNIETEQKKGKVYVYLGRFKTVDAARQARQTVQTRKVVNAPFIVAFRNGMRVPLSEVVD